jgi:DNA repair protein RadC
VTGKNASAGHRKRLREKFLRSGLSSFHDYEIIELLLTLGSPRRDCKLQAKEVIRRFKTLRGALSASPEELQEIEGIGPHSAFGIKLVREIAAEFLRQKVIDKPVYKTGREVFDYLYHSMRDLKNELFKVIYLNGQNQIIEIVDLFEGTVDTSSIYPREIMKDAIKHDAVSLIFVHNHPSGDPEPSRYDREVTRELVFAGNIMHIRVLDHIIIGNDRYYSFAAEGLIEEYQTDFLSLKTTGTAEAKRRRYKARRKDTDFLKPL